MGSHVFSDIFIHVNWHTKSDRPVLTGNLEAAVRGFLRQRAKTAKDVSLEEMGGTATHVGKRSTMGPARSSSGWSDTTHGTSPRSRAEARFWPGVFVAPDATM